MRTRSFRNENYNRRAFLRCYPLHNQKKDECNKEETVTVEDQSDHKKPKKKIFLSVFYWGGKKILLFRRLKHQLEIYIIACIPNGFKKPTALISA
ncbi:hypothetical protein CFP56_041762 [Quercus suber]|uniref:Uncharacterized protein n=1 Tax=Quercus suber TaxID=58331 RepID=A0AAW0IVK8_QUESU